VTRRSLCKTLSVVATALCALTVLALSGCAEDPFDRLSDQLGGRNIESRLAAIRELKLLRDERAIDMLVHALEDPDVINEAADALVYKGIETKTPKKDDPVIEAVTREMKATHLEPYTRAKAAWILGQIGDREAIPALKAAAADANALVKARAMDSLKQLGYYATAPVPMYVINRPPYPTGRVADSPKQLVATIASVEVSSDGIAWTMAAPLEVPAKVDLGSDAARKGDGVELTTDTPLITAGEYTWLRINIVELWASDNPSVHRSFLVEKVPEDVVVEKPGPLSPLTFEEGEFAGLVVPADWPPNGHLVLNLYLDEVVEKSGAEYKLTGLPRASLAYVGDVGRGAVNGRIRNPVPAAPDKPMYIGLYPLDPGGLTLRAIPPYATTYAGRFEVRNLPPQEFWLSAWTDCNANARQDKGDSIGFRAEPVEVKAGQAQNVEVTLSWKAVGGALPTRLPRQTED